MSKIAILFPGQGSQYNNMGTDFNDFSEYREVQTKLFQAIPECEHALRGELDINETCYAQPILFANQVGILEVVKNQFEIGDVDFGGFSLGEYSAYYGAGKYDLQTGIEIIKLRSQIMSEVKSSYQTKVVLGLTREELSLAVCEINTKATAPVLISNHNLDKQLLVNFAENDCELVISELKAAGAKRIIDLAVSGPFHTKIFAEAANQFQAAITGLNLQPGTNNLYLNLTGRKYNGESLPVVMHDHMLTGVAWVSEIEQMISDGIDTFVELGSKSVVSGLVKKINRSVNIITVENVEDLDKLEAIWNRK